LANFGHEAHHADKPNRMSRVLAATGRFTYAWAKPILVFMLIAAAVAVYGITKIRINDNPVKWFSKSHPIRQADIELNKHFGGTYMAYLVLEDAAKDSGDLSGYVDSVGRRLSEKAEELKGDVPKIQQVAPEAQKLLADVDTTAGSKEKMLDKLVKAANEKVDSAKDDDIADAWYEIADFFDLEKERMKIFKQPAVLEYIAKLQQHLADMEVVGKSNSVSDVVRKVYQELTDGSDANYKIPGSSAAVAQCLLQFQSSHNPDDLWHLAAWDYSSADIWIQLTSGDNMDMQNVVEAVDEYIRDNPPPVPLKHNWAGLTFINTVWQHKMVWGMVQSFMGSFLIVFIMMTVLFRSPLWGIICMIPLTITILVIYGIIGLIGKDYDMPVAILSALTLGMAVDFAIHFLERARQSHRATGSWRASSAVMFGEPARAITRNVLVIAIGFLPLLAAPLVPYKTVGIFLCAIMGLSGIVTLMVLPAVITLLEKKLFKGDGQALGASCNCGVCAAISTAAVVLVAINLHQYWKAGFGKLGVMSVVAIPILAVLCGVISRRESCRRQDARNKELPQNNKN